MEQRRSTRRPAGCEPAPHQFSLHDDAAELM